MVICRENRYRTCIQPHVQHEFARANEHDATQFCFSAQIKWAIKTGLESAINALYASRNANVCALRRYKTSKSKTTPSQ